MAGRGFYEERTVGRAPIRPLMRSGIYDAGVVSKM
jgi:hypothetical protein